MATSSAKKNTKEKPTSTKKTAKKKVVEKTVKKSAVSVKAKATKKTAAKKTPLTTKTASSLIDKDIVKILYNSDSTQRSVKLLELIKRHLNIDHIIFENSNDRKPSELAILNENGWSTVDAKPYSTIELTKNGIADVAKNLPSEKKGLILPISLHKDQLFTIWVYEEQNPLKKDIEVAESFLPSLLFEYQLTQNQRQTKIQQELHKQKLQEIENKSAQEKDEQKHTLEEKFNQAKHKIEVENQANIEALNNKIFNLKSSFTTQNQKSLTDLESKLNREKKAEVEFIKTDYEKKIQELIEENKSFQQTSNVKIAELQTTIEQSNAKVHSLEEKSISEISKLKETNEQKELDYLQQIEDLKKQHSDSFSKLNQDHNQNLNQLTENQNRIIDQLKSEHSTKLNQITQDHSKVIEELNQNYSNQIDELKQSQSNTIAELKQNYTNQIDELKQSRSNTIAELNQNYSKQIDELKQNQLNTIAELNQKHSKEIGELNQLLDQLNQEQQEKLELSKTQLNAKNQEWQQKLESLQQQLKAEHQAKIDKQQVDFETDKNKAIHELTEKYELQLLEKEDQLEKLNTNVARLNNEHANEIESLRKKHAEENTAFVTTKQAEISDLISKNRDDVQALTESYQNEIAKLNSDYANESNKLQDQIIELENRIGLQQKQFEQEGLQIEATHKTLVDALQTEISNRNQALSKQKDETLKLQEAFETNQHNFEQEKYEFQRQRDQLNQRIVRIEEESLLVTEELNTTIRDRESKIQNLNQNISQLHAELTERQQQIETLSTKNSSLVSELTRSENQVRDLNQTIEKLQQSHQSEKDQLIENAKQDTNRWQNYKAEIEETLAKKDSELQLKNDSIQKLNTQINHEIERAHNLQNDLEVAKTENKEFIEQNQELQQAMTDLQSENSELQGFMRSKNDEIRNYHMQEQNLKRLLQSEEQARNDLVVAIEKLKLTLTEKDELLNQGKNQFSELSAQITQLNKQIENYDQQIEQKKASIVDLQTGLNRAQSQAKNARKEGMLMAEASRALSSQPTFEAKIDYLKNNVLKDFSIDRIIFYSINNANQLIPTFSIPSFNFAKTSLQLRDTFFGQALASQKPAILQKESGEPPLDLPAPEQLLYLSEDNLLFEEFSNQYTIATRQSESTMILPLVLGAQTNGILLLTTTHLLNEDKTNMELLEHLMPFVAAAYHDEQDQKQVERLSQIVINLRTAQRFIQKRNFDLLLSRSNSIDEENRRLLNQKIRLTSPLIELADSISVEANLETYLQHIKRELKTTAIYPDFNVKVEHIMNIVTPANEDIQYLFWFIAEIATNAIEHSDARRLLMQSYIENDITIFRIEDDGEGLIRKTGSMNPTSGLGFSFLKAIAALYGLELRISKGEGGLGTAYTLATK